MRQAGESSLPIRFESFEVNLRSGELHRAGEKVRLPEQSFQILAMLLERPGEVVMRQEIQKRLWPNDTVVEFENSINAAVKRLRLALEDSADEPRYVETLARRGYRWMVPVEWVDTSPEAPQEAVPAGASPPAESAASNLTGKKVSHYRVLEVLGGGGMGVVFKAEDLKLGRRVALKFLPEETASDTLTLKRFEQEARAASALNHPNICTIYEIEEHEGQPFIVMELLEGETLRELISAARTRTAPLPLEKLIDLAVQITEGLEAAHHNGIIHRDIKPANVFVTTKGQAKILDFGLAKLVPVLATAEAYPEREQRTDDVYGTSGETALVPGSDLLLSRTGVAMGTAGYMSPEQVRGEKVDARTDLFSFGLMLYEMAAGQRAFRGETAPTLHDAILSRTPTPVRELNRELPSKLEAIIKKALEKDREVRYQTASEIRADLESLKLDLEPRHSITHWRGMTAAVVAVLLIASAIVWFAKHQPSSSHGVPDLKLRQLTTNSTENRATSGAISPDAKYLAYTDTKGIYIKLVETGEVRAVTKPDQLKDEEVEWEAGPWFPGGAKFLANAHPPGQSTDEWSSQGTSVWLVSVLGEAPRKIRDNAIAYSVSPDGSLVAFGQNKGRLGEHEIWLTGPDGEQARKLYGPAEDSSIGWLTFSPDGRQIIYVNADASGATLVSRDLRGPAVTTLLPALEVKPIDELSWLPDGRMIYSMNEPGAIGNTCNFWVMRIDPRSAKVIEKARRLTNWSGFCMTGITVTADGKHLAFLEWRAHLNSYVADSSADGMGLLNARHFPLSESLNAASDWMPDSRGVILISNRTGHGQIYKQLLGEDKATLIAPDGGRNARVSADGNWILYFQHSAESPPAPEPVMRVSIAGGPSQFLFTAKPNSLIVCARSPSDLCAIAEPTDDRGWLVLTALDSLKGRGAEIARFALDPNDDHWSVEFSPDGTRIAATRSPTGPIYILSLRGQPTQEIHVKGWSNLLGVNWTADGRSLFATAGVRTGRALLHVDFKGNAHVLWQSAGGSGETSARPSPDGRRLAISDWTMAGNVWMMENF